MTEKMYGAVKNDNVQGQAYEEAYDMGTESAKDDYIEADFVEYDEDGNQK